MYFCSALAKKRVEEEVGYSLSWKEALIHIDKSDRQFKKGYTILFCIDFCIILSVQISVHFVDLNSF